MKIQLVTAAVLIALSGSGHAMFMEVGDAGELVGTAQLVPDGTEHIMGAIDPFGDVDLYKFNHGGGSFGASTASGTLIDTQLYLFDAGGNGIVSNDDSSGLQSAITFSDLAAGMYFLGISVFNNEPVNAANELIFADGDFGLNSPAVADALLAGWDGNQVADEGSYLISFRRPTETAVIPEPTVAALLGAGLLGLSLRRRR